MKKNRVIEFEPRERILEKAKNYIESLDLFFEESDRAVPLLLKALMLAGRDLKHQIMFTLGTFAKEKVVWQLYDIMTDASETEEVRHDAAIQLSVIGPLLKDSRALAERLLKEIDSSDAERRLHATFVAWWEGNFAAAIPLIERLYDGDPRVQQTAVNAPCNLRDDRILDLLSDRLNHGPVEQKRAILFNLWRFYSKGEEVAQIYLKCLEHENPDVRFDALVCLLPLAETRDFFDVYRKGLRDNDVRIRELALKRLADEATESTLRSLRAEIEPLLDDPDMKLKRRPWRF